MLNWNSVSHSSVPSCWAGSLQRQIGETTAAHIQFNGIQDGGGKHNVVVQYFGKQDGCAAKAGLLYGGSLCLCELGLKEEEGRASWRSRSEEEDDLSAVPLRTRSAPVTRTGGQQHTVTASRASTCFARIVY